MKNINSLVLALSLLVSAPALAFFDPIPSPSGDYCKDEAIEFLKEKYGNDVQASITKFGNGQEWYYYAKVNICDGYFGFDYMEMENFTCKSKQYITRTRFLERVWADGDCKRLLPRDAYPY